MNSEILEKLQDTEIEILSFVDSFCQKYGINYSLAYGSALGAIRHSGFIPWDDDMDIFMLRNEYEKFLDLWLKECPKGYYLQDTRGISPSNINHSKIMKLNTTFAKETEISKPGYHGIFVDIFPLDRYPNKKSAQRKILLYAKLRIVYTRNHTFENGSKFLKIVSKMLLMIPRFMKDKIRNHCDRCIKKYSGESNLRLISFACPEDLKVVYPNNIMDHTIPVIFKDRKFMISNQYKDMLTCCYGNYMKLPPESERICRHQVDYIKFEEE